MTWYYDVILRNYITRRYGIMTSDGYTHTYEAHRAGVQTSCPSTYKFKRHFFRHSHRPAPKFGTNVRIETRLALTKKIDPTHHRGVTGGYLMMCVCLWDVWWCVWVSATPHLLISGICYVGPRPNCPISCYYVQAVRTESRYKCQFGSNSLLFTAFKTVELDSR